MPNNTKAKLLSAGFLIVYSLITNYISAQDSINYENTKSHQMIKPLPVVVASTLSYTGGLLYMNNNYYPDQDRVQFYFSNDIKSYLQVDKLQHVFGSYIESYLGYHYLLSLGLDKKKALLWGGPLGFIMQTPKEIIDGHFIGAGFSWGDVMGNAIGSTLMMGQEIVFGEQFCRYKFSFSRSPYADLANGFLGDNYLRSYSMDYNGHTYWLSFNANKLFLKNKIPGWLNIAVGYSANGMFGPFENIESHNGVGIPETVRYRQFLLSLDIDWLKIKTRSKFLRIVFEGLNFIKVPFPAIEYNSKGSIKGYWLYF